MQAGMAIFKREFRAYFLNPTGYIFICLFLAATGVAAFFFDDFFCNNKASLDLLTQNYAYIMVVFIPTITMSIWADEKGQGTEEILFTLPATDLQIVLGKYFAALSIYTVAVIVQLSHLVVLSILGNPDFLLALSNYLGYWLLGAGMLSLGMVASSLSGSTTVSYIYGAIFGAVMVAIGHGTWIAGLVGILIITLTVTFALRSLRIPNPLNLVVTLAVLILLVALRFLGVLDFMDPVFGGMGVLTQFMGLVKGYIAVESILYFIVLTAIMLYMNAIIIGRRNW